MYKKPFAVQGTNLLSKKDIKALRSSIIEDFPALGDKSSVLDELLPEGQVKVLKLDNRCLLYVNGDAAPAFFDAEGRGEIFPTLTTLWHHPYMMPELTIHPEVSKYVLNGADLMLPGVIVPANGVAGLGTCSKGQRRCIKIEGNPYAIAVGKMLVNQTQMEKLKGKGLEVIHVFKDTLWAFAGKPIPNVGFTEKDDQITACSDASWVPGATPAVPSSPAASPAASPTNATAPEESPAFADGSASPSAAVAAAATSLGGRAPEDWSQDDLLDFCFMQAFNLSLSEDKALPVEASDLYEKHMKPRRPEGTTLDVKKSSHKQIGKYLNAMRKAKVVDVVEKKNVVNVTKVDRGHKLFTQWKEKFASDAEAAAADGGDASASGAKAANTLPPPVVKVLYKPSHYMTSIFKIMGKRKDDQFSYDEAVGVLTSYIKKQELGDCSEGSMVKMDEEILNGIWRTAGGQKKGSTEPEEVELSVLEEKMMEEDRMQRYTSIEVAGVGATVQKGPAKMIEVTLSRKGAHNVTRACNLEAYGLDVQAMGDELKKKLNCTVHIEDMPGKNVKDKMLGLQGHVSNELSDYLLEKYGITSKFISVK